MSRATKAQDDNLVWRQAAACVLALTIIRIAYLFVQPWPLFFDEAQYWGWAKELDFGYYSKPPMIAWVIGLSTSICGDGEGCIRLFGPLLHAGTALAVYALGKELYDARTGLFSALAYATLPAVSLSSVVISTDAPLLFFWTLAIYAFVKALRTDEWRWWLITGAAGGLGMLSKYNMAMLLVSFVLIAWQSHKMGQMLRSQKFWAALAIAVLIFLPNVWWNINNHFASFLHTKDNASIGGLVLHGDKVLEFLAAQFGVFGPVFFTVLLVVLFRYKQTLNDQNNALLIWCILPLFVVIVTVSLLSRAHANWAAPIYAPATILVVRWLLQQKRPQWIIGSMAVHLFAVMLIANVQTIASAVGWTITGKHARLSMLEIKDPFVRIKGWPDLGRLVNQAWEQYPYTVLLTESRRDHAELLYYVNPHPFDAVKWNPDRQILDHYDLTTDISQAGTRDFLFVSQRQSPESVWAQFESHELVREIIIPLYEDYQLHYYIHYLKGFKGYASESH